MGRTGERLDWALNPGANAGANVHPLGTPAKLTLAQAAVLLARNRAGEGQRKLAAEVGVSTATLNGWLTKAQRGGAGERPRPVGLQRTVREVLEAIINDSNARHADIVAAARALDGLKGEVLDGDS